MKTLYDFDLRDLQRYLVKMIHKVRYILVAVDMSLGKTGAVLMFLYDIWLSKPHYRVIVVAPLLVAEETWPEELYRWFFARVFSFAVITGTVEERKRALRKDVFIHIINKENLQWLWKELKEGKDWDYQIIVIDEASMLKEGKHRTKTKKKGKGSKPLSRFGILARASSLEITKYVIELTGSPAPEGLHNMWGPVYVLDHGERLGGRKTHFIQRWFDTGFMGYDRDPLPYAEKQIMGRVSDIMISLRAEDHLKLPPVVTTPDTDLWVTLPKKLMREYKRFERHLYTEEYDVEAVSKGVLTNKLLQFANGSLYRSKDEDIWVHDLKAHKLVELVESLEGRPLIVAVSYKFDRIRIKKFLGKKVTFLEDAGKNWKKDWDRGRIGVLGTHPASLSHGLNMQFGGARACHYGLTHSGELYTQFNGRLPRPGQREDRVWIYHILTRGTEDEKVLQDKQDKQGSEARIRRRVRIRREEIMRELRDS